MPLDAGHITLGVSMNYTVCLDAETKRCECCHRSHMRKTLKISMPTFGHINIGVICANRWFDVNCTGNIYKAIERLGKRINKIPEHQMKQIFWNIRTNAYHEVDNV